MLHPIWHFVTQKEMFKSQWMILKADLVADHVHWFGWIGFHLGVWYIWNVFGSVNIDILGLNTNDKRSRHFMSKTHSCWISHQCIHSWHIPISADDYAIWLVYNSYSPLGVAQQTSESSFSFQICPSHYSSRHFHFRSAHLIIPLHCFTITVIFKDLHPSRFLCHSQKERPPTTIVPKQARKHGEVEKGMHTIEEAKWRFWRL